MEALALFGGCVLLLALPAISALLSIYNAYWAVRIWALLVVPTLHWPALPLAGAVGIAMGVRALWPREYAPDDARDKRSASVRIATAIMTPLILGPMLFGVAWIASRVLL